MRVRGENGGGRGGIGVEGILIGCVDVDALSK